MNVGPVFVGNLGSPTRRTFTVMGDAVNLAARLMQKAETGPGRRVERGARSFVDELRRRRARALPREGQDRADPCVRRARAQGATRAGAPAASRRARRTSCESCSRAPKALVRATAGSSRSSANPARGRRDCSKSCAPASPSSGSSRPSADSTRAPRRTSRSAPRCSRWPASDRTTTADVAAARLAEWVDAVAPELATWLPLIAIPFDIEMPLTAEVSDIAPQFRRARAHQAVSELVSPRRAHADAPARRGPPLGRRRFGGARRRAHRPRPVVPVAHRPDAPAGPATARARSIGGHASHLEPLDDDAALDLVRAAAGDDAALSPVDWTKLARTREREPALRDRARATRQRRRAPRTRWPTRSRAS